MHKKDNVWLLRKMANGIQKESSAVHFNLWQTRKTFINSAASQGIKKKNVENLYIWLKSAKSLLLFYFISH